MAQVMTYALGGGRTEDDKTFDRQVRLWGSHGQKLLRTSRVLAIGSSATITEALKSVVLPSIGGIVILDDVRVTAEDLGNNFFVGYEDIDKPRAVSVGLGLAELNPRVCVQACPADPRAFVAALPPSSPSPSSPSSSSSTSITTFTIERCYSELEGRSTHTIAEVSAASLVDLTNYTAIIVDPTTLSEIELVQLDQAARSVTIPLLTVCALGLVGVLRLSITEQCIIETHPKNYAQRYDLALHPRQLSRCLDLVKFAFDPKYDILDISPADLLAGESKDSLSYGSTPEARQQVHSRVPFVVILIRALFYSNHRLRQAIQGLSPGSQEGIEAARNAIKAATLPDTPLPSLTGAMVRESGCHVPYGVPFEALTAEVKRMRLLADQENFDEALANVYHVSGDVRLDKALLNIDSGAQTLPPPPMTPLTKQVLDTLSSSTLPSTSKGNLAFWLCVDALIRFLGSSAMGNGCFPMLSSIPDMTTETSTYVAIKQLYRNLATRDAEAFATCLDQAFQTHSTTSSSSVIFPFASVSDVLNTIATSYGVDDPLNYFLTNSRGLRVVTTRSLSQELNPSNPSDILVAREALLEYNDDQLSSGTHPSTVPLNTQWYLSYRAILRYNTHHRTLPGRISKYSRQANRLTLSPTGSFNVTERQAWEDEGKAAAEFHSALHEEIFGKESPAQLNTECTIELARQGCAEVHTSAAVIGSMASDALLKCVLRQYVPFNNTLVYNGIHGIGSVFIA